MYAERYDRTGGIKPGSLAVAIGINVAVLGAVLLAAPEIIELKPPTILKTINIPIPPPPPPHDPVTPKAQTNPTPQPVTPDPIIKTSNPPVEVTLTGTTIIPSGPVGEVTGGTGTGVIVEPAPPPPPVFVDPTLDKRYADGFQPSYPSRERQLERDGSVVVRVLIGTDGRVKRVERLSATSDDFFNETERTALARWRFRPGTRNGEPVERWKTMRVTFRLEDA